MNETPLESCPVSVAEVSSHLIPYPEFGLVLFDVKLAHVPAAWKPPSAKRELRETRGRRSGVVRTALPTEASWVVIPTFVENVSI